MKKTVKLIRCEDNKYAICIHDRAGKWYLEEIDKYYPWRAVKYCRTVENAIRLSFDDAEEFLIKNYCDMSKVKIIYDDENTVVTRVMWFNMYGNTIAVYHNENDKTGIDNFTIYLMAGKKKCWIDDADSYTEAAQIAMNYCHENAC